MDFNFDNYRWHLRPLADCHYSSSGSWGHYTTMRVMSTSWVRLAAVILLISALNYVLLSVASVSARGQEAGVRKVMGARRFSIILQFWVETQLLVLAGRIDVALYLWRPDCLCSIRCSIRAISPRDTLDRRFFAVLAIAFSGILAGYYPAWALYIVLCGRQWLLRVFRHSGSIPGFPGCWWLCNILPV